MPQKPKVSIIVVSYNTREMTLECLRSVVAETRSDFELIVVDNASEDGSAEAIRQEAPQARLMAETANHGFALANNMAAEIATGDYILLLNPDTVVLDGAIDKILAFAERQPGARMWGGRTLFANGKLNATSCYRRMTVWSLFCQAMGLTSAFRKSALFNPESYGGWPRDTEREVDIVTGCFLLIKHEDWHALGGFNTQYKMYGEDADLSLRARNLGARPRITPDAVIVHHLGASEKVRADKLVRLLNAKTTLIDDHFAASKVWLAKKLLSLWPLSRAILNLAVGRAETAKVWYSVWKRSSEWRDGWPTAQVPVDGKAG